jgi:hypothetical protein
LILVKINNEEVDSKIRWNMLMQLLLLLFLMWYRPWEISVIDLPKEPCYFHLVR